jgi:hypothetical protein
MPGQGRKRSDAGVAPVVEGELVPSRLEELDEPAGREGLDELEDDAVEMNEDEDAAADEDEEDEEDEDEEADEDEDEDDEDDDEDEDDEDDEEADPEAGDDQR